MINLIHLSNDEKILDSLLFTGQSFYSISSVKANKEIIDKIKYIEKKIKKKINIITIVNDSIVFSDYFPEINFSKIQAVELDKLTYDCAVHNIKLMNKKNIEIHNTDYLKCLNFKQDVVYFDPPWGDNYKNLNL